MVTIYTVQILPRTEEHVVSDIDTLTVGSTRVQEEVAIRYGSEPGTVYRVPGHLIGKRGRSP